MDRLEKYLDKFTNYSELTTEILFSSNKEELLFLIERLIKNNKVDKLTFCERKKYKGLVGSSLKTFWIGFNVKCPACNYENSIVIPLSSYKYDVHTISNGRCRACNNYIKLK